METLVTGGGEGNDCGATVEVLEYLTDLGFWAVGNLDMPAIGGRGMWMTAEGDVGADVCVVAASLVGVGLLFEVWVAETTVLYLGVNLPTGTME